MYKKDLKKFIAVADTHSCWIGFHESFSCQNMSFNQIINMDKVYNGTILSKCEDKKSSLNVWLQI